ncbi:MAG: hypothetical protein H6709_03450 [Kofleriaceae bacterium]|nr:hypothetical protein [Kofleriaceae bacterium]
MPPPLQPVEEDEAAAAAAATEPPVRPSTRRITLAQPDDDEVFTSASRDSAPLLPQGPTDDELFGDLPDEIGEPVVPGVVAGGAAADVEDAARTGERSLDRVGPAVVRREDLERRRRAGSEDDSPFGGADSTRVADLAEMERLAGERRARRQTGGAGDAGAAGGDFGGGESTRVADLAELERLASGDAAAGPARRGSGPIARSSGPAIIPRRPGTSDDDGGFGGGDFGSGESTRIADLGQLEKLAQENRVAREAEAAAAAAALFDDAPSVELSIDEDFYADFEIGDSAGEVSGEAAAADVSTGTRRATAHVVRRGKVTREDDSAAVVVEMEAEPSDEFDAVQVARLPEPGTPEEVAAEDDFSDVAAAMSEPLPPPSRRSSELREAAAAAVAASAAGAAEHDFADVAAAVAEPAPPPARAESSVDDALAGSPTRSRPSWPPPRRRRRPRSCRRRRPWSLPAPPAPPVVAAPPAVEVAVPGGGA